MTNPLKQKPYNENFYKFKIWEGKLIVNRGKKKSKEKKGNCDTGYLLLSLPSR